MGVFDGRRITVDPQQRVVPRLGHNVACPYCGKGFDVFAAVWCNHPLAERSKICPHCDRCLCQHPAYQEPLFWKEAPLAFQRQGFQRLFLFYL